MADTELKNILKPGFLNLEAILPASQILALGLKVNARPELRPLYTEAQSVIRAIGQNGQDAPSAIGQLRRRALDFAANPIAVQLFAATMVERGGDYASGLSTLVAAANRPTAQTNFDVIRLYDALVFSSAVKLRGMSLIFHHKGYREPAYNQLAGGLGSLSVYLIERLDQARPNYLKLWRELTMILFAMESDMSLAPDKRLGLSPGVIADQPAFPLLRLVDLGTGTDRPTKIDRLLQLRNRREFANHPEALAQLGDVLTKVDARREAVLIYTNAIMCEKFTRINFAVVRQKLLNSIRQLNQLAIRHKQFQKSDAAGLFQAATGAAHAYIRIHGEDADFAYELKAADDWLHHTPRGQRQKKK